MTLFLFYAIGATLSFALGWYVRGQLGDTRVRFFWTMCYLLCPRPTDWIVWMGLRRRSPLENGKRSLLVDPCAFRAANGGVKTGGTWKEDDWSTLLNEPSTDPFLTYSSGDSEDESWEELGVKDE